MAKRRANGGGGRKPALRRSFALSRPFRLFRRAQRARAGSNRQSRQLSASVGQGVGPTFSSTINAP